MSETISPQRFHEAGWRIVRDDASTHFRTGSFAAGMALVDAIGRLADAALARQIHIDIYVPHDQAEARVAAAIAAGGHVVSDENAPGWWTLADAEGNEVDVASWPDRD